MTIAYSQRDVEWSDDQLGTSPDLNVGQAGCLITAIASSLSDFTSRTIAPGELNQWLRENGGFTGGGLFVWDSIVSLGLRRAETIQCVTQPAPVKRLAELLADGAAVVVEVDSIPDGPLNQHWVRLLSVDDTDGQIMDPWQLPGREFIALSRYFAADWTPSRAIFMAVVYRPAAATRELIGDGDHQPAPCIRPEETPGRAVAPATTREPSKRRKRAKPQPANA